MCLILLQMETRDAELLKLSAKLDEEKTLTKNANAELLSEKSKAVRLELDLNVAKQGLVNVKEYARRLEDKVEATKALNTYYVERFMMSSKIKNNLYTWSQDEVKALTQNANVLESDLIEMTRKKVVFLY